MNRAGLVSGFGRAVLVGTGLCWISWLLGSVSSFVSCLLLLLVVLVKQIGCCSELLYSFCLKFTDAKARNAGNYVLSNIAS